MKELFLPYKLAVIAKNKGFNEECFGYYGLDESFNYNIPEEGMHVLLNKSLTCNAPLYQQIVDWFREKHSKDIHVWHNGEKPNEWTWVINDILSDHYEAENDVNDYYKALNKAIEEAFKLI